MLWYQTCYNRLQQSFGESKIESQYMDTDSVVIGFETDKLFTELRKL